MKQLLLLLLLLPMLVVAQEKAKGIRFEEGLTWEQVKAKAKQENKFIFVDCYATWCQPCKVMDNGVYPNDTVGTYMNERFISVKVQMDSTKKDHENIQLLYPAARQLEKEYIVTGLPTFLFFSPEGIAVHKEMGTKNVQEFVQLAVAARNPKQQLYTLINQAKDGKMPYADMATLALKLKRDYKENKAAEPIAKEYKMAYLDKLSNQQLCTKDNLSFIGSFSSLITLNDKIFDLYYHHPAQVDSAIGRKGYAKQMVNYVISKNMLDPYIIEANKKASEPNWNRLERNIKRKFGNQLAKQNTINAKVRWSAGKKDNVKYVKYLVQQIDYTGLSTFQGELGGLILNNNAWKVFLYSTNRTDLEKALQWTDHAFNQFKKEDAKATVMDTKANILYKLERRDEAISLEAKAAILSKDELFSKEASKTLERMKKGEPTWNNIEEK
jgi:thioredoxin-related protein